MQRPARRLAAYRHLACRLAYLFSIGLRLRAAERAPAADAATQAARWGRFKRHAAFILYADGITTALIIAASLDTLAIQGSAALIRIVGVVLVAIGIAVKSSAYRTIGERGYYWFNFFSDERERSYVKRGIYRYLDNPMYGPGYLHAIGFPLVFLSFWGLISALFDWAAVWVFYLLFERPHTLRHTRRSTGRTGEARSALTQ